MENVAYVAYVAGNFDIIIQAYLPHMEGLFKFLNEDLEKIDGIASTQTWNVLRTEKFFYNWEGEDLGLEPSPAADGDAPDDHGPPESAPVVRRDRLRPPPVTARRVPPQPLMTAAVLALLASFSWGTADFLAGLESRRSTAWTAALGGQAVASLSLIALLAVWRRSGRRWSRSRRRRSAARSAASASSCSTGRSRWST